MAGWEVGYAMFPNLKAEMARRNIKVKDLASSIGVAPKTVYNRLSGRTEFTLSEMLTIKRHYFPDLTLDYLFNKDVTA